GRAPRGPGRSSRTVAASQAAIVAPPRPSTGRRGRRAARRPADPRSRARQPWPRAETPRRLTTCRRSLGTLAAERRGAAATGQPMAPPSPPDPGPACRLIDRAAESIERQVPGADIADLATPEPGLEVGDATGRQTPQVVARGALLARAADRFPLEQVVRPALA